MHTDIGELEIDINSILGRVAYGGNVLLSSFRLNRYFDLKSLYDSQLLEIINKSYWLCERIFEDIKRSDNDKTRKTLINLKRDIHNRRNIRTFESIPDYLLKECKSFNNQIQLLHSLKDNIKDIYRHEEELIQSHLLSLFNENRNFSLGIMFASPDFYSRICRHLDGNLKIKTKDFKALIRKIHNYAIRYLVKTTPFGSFSGIVEVISKINNNNSCYIGNKDIQLYLQPNKLEIFDLSKKIKNLSKFKNELTVSLNPSLHIMDNYIYFVGYNEYGDFKEKRVKLTDSLCNLINNIKNTIKECDLTLADLHDKLVINYDSHEIIPVKKIYPCLQFFIENDILLQEQIIHEDPAWYKEMENVLPRSEYECDETTQLYNYFAKINKCCDTFNNNPETVWHEYIKFTKHTPFINTKLNGNVIFDDKKYEKSLALIKMWVKTTFSLSWHHAEHGLMSVFFNSRYSNSQSINFIDFFKDYHYSFLSKGSGLEEVKKTKTFQLLLSNRKKIIDFIKSHCSKHKVEEVIIPSSELFGLLGQFLINDNKHISTSLLFYLYKDKIILPSGRYHPGFGRMHSRFLTMFDKKYIAKFKEMLAKNSSDHIYADISSDDFFTGNTYPVLFEYNIHFTGARKKFTKNIPINDLTITRKNHDKLELKWRDKVVYPIDIGFLDARQTSPLKKILRCFSPSGSFSLPYIWENNGPITFRPRISIDEDLILYRKAWLVQPNCMPLPIKNQDDEEYFFILHNWKETHQIPSEVFCKILTSNQTFSDTPFYNVSTINKTPLKKYLTTFFVDFRNPLSVCNIKEVVQIISDNKNLDVYFVFEEVLPSFEDSLNINGEPHCIEYLLQLAST